MPTYDVQIIGTPPHPYENSDGELILCEVDGDGLTISHKIRTALAPYYPNWSFVIHMKEKTA